MNYKIKQGTDHFIEIELNIDTKGKESIDLQLPTWRPGRYELALFAQKVRGFRAESEGKALGFEKTDHSTWRIDSKRAGEVRILYSFYADVLDAGSTYSDDEQLYVNPVNCCMYISGEENEPCSVQLDIPNEWQIASSIAFDDQNYGKCQSFHELADSPFIASGNLKKWSYEAKGIPFHLWIQGEFQPDQNKLLEDFKAFTTTQLEMMEEFPAKEFHFLFQIAPYRLYHGVEHLKSTVIALGPGHALTQGQGYAHILEISSHELFHCWNVKSIRSEELYPYDYSGENYFKTGYIAEGITTYYGDHLLFQSGLYKEQKYFPLVETNIQRHMDNDARFNNSLAASSFDLWIDGYKKGIPHRKLSIYSDGALMAMLADLTIIKATDGAFSLIDAMKLLYQRFAKEGKGISETIYKNILEEISGVSFAYYFELLNTPSEYLGELQKALNEIGYYISTVPSAKFHEAHWGIKVDDNTGAIQSIIQNSAGEQSGLFHRDKIIALNGIHIDKDFSGRTAHLQKEETCQLLINRKGRQLSVSIAHQGERGFQQYKLKPNLEITAQNRKLFNKWANR